MKIWWGEDIRMKVWKYSYFKISRGYEGKLMLRYDYIRMWRYKKYEAMKICKYMNLWAYDIVKIRRYYEMEISRYEDIRIWTLQTWIKLMNIRRYDDVNIRIYDIKIYNPENQDYLATLYLLSWRISFIRILISLHFFKS